VKWFAEVAVDAVVEVVDAGMPYKVRPTISGTYAIKALFLL
jgi:hypothetical protein